MAVGNIQKSAPIPKKPETANSQVTKKQILNKIAESLIRMYLKKHS